MIKRLTCLFILALLFCMARAQQPAQTIKAGSKIDYKFFLYGQTVPVTLTIKSVTGDVILDWYIRGGIGSYLIPAAAFENGKRLNFIQPAQNTEIKLGENETFALISKSAFRTLQKDKKLVYNNTTYVLKENEPVFQAGSLQLDVLHVVGQEEAGDLWILNDPEFPLICQFSNNPLGINFSMIAIK